MYDRHHHSFGETAANGVAWAIIITWLLGWMFETGSGVLFMLLLLGCVFWWAPVSYLEDATGGPWWRETNADLWLILILGAITAVIWAVRYGVFAEMRRQRKESLAEKELLRLIAPPRLKMPRQKMKSFRWCGY